jgi:hypothetical protein
MGFIGRTQLALLLAGKCVHKSKLDRSDCGQTRASLIDWIYYRLVAKL